MVIDPEGYVVSCVAGEGHRDDLEQIVEQLIQEHQGKRTFSAQNFSLKLEKQRQPLITPLAFPGKVLATTASLFITDSGHHRLVISSLGGIDSFLFIADTNNHIIRRANINTWEVNIMNFPQLCAPDFCFP